MTAHGNDASSRLLESNQQKSITGMKVLRPFAADRRKASQQGKEAAPVAQEATVQRAPELRRQGSPENRLLSLLNHEDRATLRLKLKAQFLKPLRGDFSNGFSGTLQVSNFTHFSAPPFLISPQSVGPPWPTSSTPSGGKFPAPEKSGPGNEPRVPPCATPERRPGDWSSPQSGWPPGHPTTPPLYGSTMRDGGAVPASHASAR